MVLENEGGRRDFHSESREFLVSPGALVRLTAIRTFSHEKDHPDAGDPVSGGGAGSGNEHTAGRPRQSSDHRRQTAGCGRVEKDCGGGQEGKRKALIPAQKLQACQDIDDATKERLNCYDAIYAPQPKPKAPAAKAVNDCRFVKEEDDRLTCYNGFADKIPKLPR